MGQELARNPDARAKAAEVVAKTQRLLNDDIKPRARQAWQNAQPDIEHAKREIKRVAQEVRDEYRKGRDGT